MGINFDKNGFAENSGWISVYNHDYNGEFLDVGTVYISEGGGIPINTTLTPPPPAKDGFAIVLKNGSWEYEEDHRGQVFYDKATRGKVEIKDLGPIPSNLTSLIPTSDHDRWNATLGKWELDTDSKNKTDAEEFSNYRQVLIQRLRSVAEKASQPLLDEYPAVEVNSFPIQKAEALAYKAGENLNPTFLSRLAKERGIPLDELVEKVLKKTTLYETLTGEIAGKRQFIMDKFDHAKTMDDLKAIDKIIEEWATSEK